MKTTDRLVYGLVMASLFLSGIAGLVYEVVWSRYLALFLGHTSHAVVAVLVAFMGGLAIGNAWLGSRADASRRPLAFYGVLEIGVGVYAILFPTYFDWCQNLYVSLARHGEPGSPLLHVLKFVFSLLTILLPTILMGGTLPVLTRLLTRSLSELREKVASLYFINSAGAVAGCVIGGFWWVPVFGLEMTMLAAASLNLVVGGFAVALSRHLGEGERGAQVRPGEASDRKPDPSPEPRSDAAGARQDVEAAGETLRPSDLTLATVAIGVSGFVAMLYQVAWTRLLALALGSTTHAFTIMLLTFITGIAVGSWIIYRWRGLRRLFDAFGWAELALAGTLLVSMFFYGRLPFWFAELTQLLSRTPEAYPVYQTTQALVCFLVMFVPAVCLGMTLPLIARVTTAEMTRLGRSVGRVFAVNTLGTVLGAAITGFLIMPALGLARTFLLGLSANALIGLMVLLRRRYPLRWPGWFAAVALSAGLVWGGGFFFEEWKRTLTSALWRPSNRPGSWESFRERLSKKRVVYYRDGAGATVSVMAEGAEDDVHLSLQVNGKTDASSSGDIGTQLLLAHIPMLLKPDSEDVLIVGFGSGMTAGGVSVHPGVRKIDVIEISPEVVDAARHFAPYNANILEQSILRVYVEDAKSFLQTTDQTYDVVISEPSNPWMAGVAGVFSLDFYESCRAKLGSDGLMVQWLHIYESNDDVFSTIVGTFSSVFPFTSVWATQPGDLVLVGSVTPREPDLGALHQRFHEPAVLADLQRMDLARVPVFLAREIISQTNGRFAAEIGYRPHSDFFPVLEFIAQRAFFVGGEARRWDLLNELDSPRPTSILPDYLADYPLGDDDFRGFGSFFLANDLPPVDLLRSILTEWRDRVPDAVLPLELSAALPYRGDAAALEVMRLFQVRDAIFERAAEDPLLLRQYARFLMRRYRSDRSAFHLPAATELDRILPRLLETDPANQRLYRFYQAELAWDRGEDQESFEIGLSAMNPDASFGPPLDLKHDPTASDSVLVRMLETLWRQERIDDAVVLVRDAAKLGFIDLQSDSIAPRLDRTLRKIEAAAGVSRQ